VVYCVLRHVERAGVGERGVPAHAPTEFGADCWVTHDEQRERGVWMRRSACETGTKDRILYACVECECACLCDTPY
jgi:hypothetical protein